MVSQKISHNHPKIAVDPQQLFREDSIELCEEASGLEVVATKRVEGISQVWKQKSQEVY